MTRKKIKNKNEEIILVNIEYYDLERTNTYAMAHIRKRSGSVFDKTNQIRVNGIIGNINSRYGLRKNSSILDLGCGTGNILKIAEQYFENLYGIDVSFSMLRKAKEICPKAKLIRASADKLPFKPNTFDCVTLYSVLHHIYDIESVLEEIYVVLVNGGVLYTDNDPNSYFIFRKFRIVKELLKPVDTKEKLAEYHKFTGGLDPLLMEKKLKAIGFQNIMVNFRGPVSSEMSKFSRVYRFILNLLARVYPKRFYHYFWILAQK
jgi:ubiquinone/menaquinone biosynthesis C-methylase UbiE